MQRVWMPRTTLQVYIVLIYIVKNYWIIFYLFVVFTLFLSLESRLLNNFLIVMFNLCKRFLLYRDLKEHLRRLQQQSDTRRRQAVMEMMRQRAAEVAGNAGWAICTCKYDILLRNHQIFCAGLPGQLSITKQWWGEVVELDSCEVHSEYTTEWFVITCLLGNNLW